MVIGPKHPNERALLKLEWICYWFLKYPSPPPTSHPVGRSVGLSLSHRIVRGWFENGEPPRIPFIYWQDRFTYRPSTSPSPWLLLLLLLILVTIWCVRQETNTIFWCQIHDDFIDFRHFSPVLLLLLFSISPTTSVCSGAAMPFHWSPFESQAKPNHRKFPQLECYYYYYYFGSPPTKQINTTTHSVCRKSLSRGDWRDEHECHHQIEIFSSKSQELSSTYESSVRSLVHVTRIGWLFCQPSAFSSEVAPEVHNCRQSNKSPPVFVSFRPQNVSRPLNDLLLLGQCHKITISKVACTLLSSLHPWPHSSLFYTPERTTSGRFVHIFICTGWYLHIIETRTHIHVTISIITAYVDSLWNPIKALQ